MRHISEREYKCGTLADSFVACFNIAESSELRQIRSKVKIQDNKPRNCGFTICDEGCDVDIFVSESCQGFVECEDIFDPRLRWYPGNMERYIVSEDCSKVAVIG